MLILCVLVVLLQFQTAAQAPQPVLTCLSVISNDSVEVSWEIPSGTFAGFRLFYGPPGGPFISSDYSATINSAKIAVSNVSTNKYEFFLSTYTNPPIIFSPESNHLFTIVLNISGDGTGVARLDWNEQGTQDLGYRILRSTDGVNFTSLGSFSPPRKYDTINGFCDPTTFYYVIEHGPCNARSNVVSASLRDLTPPDDPRITLITVNSDGFAEIFWEPGSSTDVDGYIVERLISTGYPFDTAGLVTSIVDNFVNDTEYLSPCDEVVSYVVRAQDQCLQASSGEISYTNPQNTILLTGNTSELCDKKATLRWNEYRNMNPPVSHYKIERSINGDPFVDIENITSLGISTYEYVDQFMLDAGVEVRYRIGAVDINNSKVSHSCELLLLPAPAEITEFQIDYVTVIDNSFITLEISATPPTVPFEVEIYRLKDDMPDLIAKAPWDNSGTLTFDDINVQVNSENYLYSARLLDECGFTIATTNEFNSLLLDIAIDNNENPSLLWNNHVGWGVNLMEYRMYKYNDGVLMSGYPKTIPVSLTGYDEADSPDNGFNTTFIVGAVHSDGRVSQSNEVLLPRKAQVEIPTAFRPSGVNTSFRPILKNVDPASYLLVIYNRWGQRIFETRNLIEGWDGKFNGRMEQGIYIYQVSYNDQSGSTIIERGSVMLFD
jgi:hypothetical protein